MNGNSFLKSQFSLHTNKDVLLASNRSFIKRGKKVANVPESLINNYFSRIQEIISKSDKSEKYKGIDAVKKILYDKHVIKSENIQESHFEMHNQIAKDRGDDIPFLYKYHRELEKNRIIEEQKDSLDDWINYLISNQAVYPDWMKYWFFRGVLETGRYDKNKSCFLKRTKHTVAPFPERNEEALGYIGEFIENHIKGEYIKNPVEKENEQYVGEVQLISDEDFKKIMDTRNFLKYYAFSLEHQIFKQTELHPIIKGEWKKFRMRTDVDKMTKTLRGYGTGWCIAGNRWGTTNLNKGDMCIYYSENNLGERKIPRLCIRFEGNVIREISGVAKGQNLDNYIPSILEEKLKDFGEEGEKYLKRIANARKLSDLCIKTGKKESLSIENLRFLWEIDEEIESFRRFGKDPRIAELRSERNREDDIIKIFLGENTTKKEIKEKVCYKGEKHNEKTEIIFGSLTIKKDSLLPEKLKYISGRITINSSDGLLGEKEASKLLNIHQKNLIITFLKHFKLHEEFFHILFDNKSYYQGLIIENLDSFTGLTEETAINILNNYSKANWKKILSAFDNLSNNFAYQLCDKNKKKSGSVAENIDIFPNADFELAKKLIEIGRSGSVLKNKNKYKDINDQELVDFICKKGDPSNIPNHIEKLKIDNSIIIQELLDKNCYRSVIKNIDSFYGIEMNSIVQKYLDKNSVKLVLNNLDKMTGLTSEMSKQLYIRGGKSKIYQNLKSFDRLDRIILSGKINKHNFIKNIHKFDNLYFTDIKKFINRGLGNQILENIDRIIESDRGKTIKHIEMKK